MGRSVLGAGISCWDRSRRVAPLLWEKRNRQRGFFHAAHKPTNYRASRTESGLQVTCLLCRLFQGYARRSFCCPIGDGIKFTAYDRLQRLQTHRGGRENVILISVFESQPGFPSLFSPSGKK
ncbi:hypothetical protein PoMZ_01703 [Pyricularia oryzae]|uniref:Uncharacterized protein n=1 Tax=Pyricularia oryzae TaxID=318829 RepID=A0A4P7N2V9_PYROR|nr:hypothetical protein PoMZ_01703 [Pyricularia oryzae]